MAQQIVISNKGGTTYPGAFGTAMRDAASGDSIIFNLPGTDKSNTNLISCTGLTVFNGKNLDIDGSNTSGDEVILTGLGNKKLFEVASGSEVNFCGMTMTSGKLAFNSQTKGGGSSINNSGTVSLSDILVAGGTFYVNIGILALGSAGLYNAGTATLADVTFSGNTAVTNITSGTITLGGAVCNYTGAINITGTIDLVTATDTWINSGTEKQYATVNWDITGGTTTYGTIKNFERYSNKDNYVNQTITVTADQAAGDYTIATGDLSSLAKNVKTFTVKTADDETGVSLTVGGSASYNGATYTLANSNNEQLVLTVAGQTGPVYFSVTWAGLESGTKVTVAGNTLTIGTDAFASYALAQASGASTIKSADTYLNSSYNETDPIVLISGYTATFGTDAFADQASAVAAAKSMGGALDVTGGTFSGLNVSGIETSFFTDVTTDSLYLVGAAAEVGGDVTATISGKSYLTKGLYVVDEGGSVGGNVAITVAGGEIYRRGIQIYGTVNGTSSVTVTGDATISSIMDTFDTVTINEGVTLNYGIGVEGDWDNSYLYGFRNLVNNGTLNYNAELGQNAYAMLYETGSGDGTIELGDNIEFGVGGTTYVAEVQKRVLINGDWDGKGMFDVINVDGGEVIYGVSAFGTKEGAQYSNLTSDKTTFIEYGKSVEGPVHGEDGHLGFVGGTVTGGTVTDAAFAGEEITEAVGTILQSSELVALGTIDYAGDYQYLFGGYDIGEYADTTIKADSSLVVGTMGSEGTVIGGMLVGGSLITAAAVDWIGKSTVSVTSGTFSDILIGGAFVNGENASISGTLNTEVTLSGATVKELCGGCYLQNGGSIDVSGTANVTLTNCTVVGSVFGGNSANDPSVSTKDTSLWNGNINITIDATKSVVIGGDLVAGSFNTGKVSGNASITITGSGDNLSIGGDITGDSIGGDPYSASKKYVTGTRELNFNNFNGTFGSADKKVWCFDAVSLVGSSVTLAGDGRLMSVGDWQITDSTLVWTKGENDFEDDQLTLTYSGELTGEWTVFQLTDKLTTGWNAFATDGSGVAKIIISVNGEGTIAAYDDKAEAYLGTIDGEDYRFYLDYRKYGESLLKVAKTVAKSGRVVAVSGASRSLVDGATYKVAAYDGNGGAVEVQEGGVVTGNNVVFNGNTVTSGSGGAIYNNGTVILSGIFDLATASDTWVNSGSGGEKCATVNWDLTQGIPDYGSVKHFERYSNDNEFVKQTITVAATQAVGQYVIATGDFTDIANKDTFIVKTAEDATGAEVKIKGAAVGYGKRIYSLEVDDNGTPAISNDDKLILNAEVGCTVLEVTKAAGRGPVDDFLVYSKGACPLGGADRGSVFASAFFGGTVSGASGLLASPTLAL